MRVHACTLVIHIYISINLYIRNTNVLTVCVKSLLIMVWLHEIISLPICDNWQLLWSDTRTHTIRLCDAFVPFGCILMLFVFFSALVFSGFSCCCCWCFSLSASMNRTFINSFLVKIIINTYEICDNTFINSIHVLCRMQFAICVYLFCLNHSFIFERPVSVRTAMCLCARKREGKWKTHKLRGQVNDGIFVCE